jgi:lipopolysaccharide export system permease protein
MAVKTLQRYVLKELVFPFLMGIGIFTFILIMDKIFALADLIVKYGVPAFTVLKLLLYILPATFAITIPMGCLVAVIVAFSRLKSDNELTAMKASGVSVIPLTLVAMLFGGGLTGVMIWFNNQVLPSSNYAYKSLYYNVVSKRAAIVIREHVFVNDFDGYIFRVGETNPLSNELKDIMVFSLGRKETDPLRTIVAKRGRLITDDKSRRVMLKLEEGFMQMTQAKDPLAFARLEFDTNLLDLDINNALSNQTPENLKSAREMSMREIQNEINSGRAGGEDLNLLKVEYHKKISIPFACLAFVLIGVPLGVLAPRSGKYLAYFVGVLLIFMYYILLSLGETFGMQGRIPPFLSMWLPNLVLISIGLYGMIWIIQERPPLMVWRKRLKAEKA